MEKNILGKCPKCGKDIVGGKYGPYCEGKCGMFVSKAFGKDLTEAQVKSLLEGKKTLVKGLVSKAKGTKYDIYLTVKGVEDYKYTGKDGSEKTGARFVFDRDFPEKKENPADTEAPTEDAKPEEPDAAIEIDENIGEDVPDTFSTDDISDDELPFM